MMKSLKNRADSEHEQVLVRLGLAIFALVFLLVSYAVAGETETRVEMITAALFYMAFSVSLAIALWFSPQPSVLRRVLGICTDMGIVTYALTISGDIGAPLYGGYLWGIISYGFRFGKRYLYLAQVLAIAGFSYVIATGNFWQAYPMLGIGLLIWLVVIPPYTSILLSRLGEAVSEAEKADIAKTHFLSNMSHELRTPLNAIIGYSEILGEEMHESGQDEYASDLRNIHNSGTHLLGLVNELLDLSKINEGRMDICPETINVHELITDVLNTIHPLAEKNANQLDVDVMPEISTMHTDLTKLRQVLFNLLSNACKFTQNGHIALIVNKKMMPSRNGNDNCLEFKIIDDGIGVAADKIESIFLPFRQESFTTNKEYGGTGLGLALSKQFCELMGGKLMVKSNKGIGSTFTVLLPLKPPAPNDAPSN